MNLKTIERILIVLEVLVIIILLILRGGFGVKELPDSIAEKSDNSQSQTGSHKAGIESDTLAETTEEDSVLNDYSYQVQNKVRKMNTEEKVAQLFILSFDELTETQNANQAGEKTKAEIDKYPIGGIIYSFNNFVSQNQFLLMLSNQEKYIKDRIGLKAFVMADESIESIVQNDALKSTFIAKDELSDLNLYDAKSASSKDIVDAINDGSYMIYNPKNFRTSYKAVLDAVDEGVISTSTLDKALCEVVAFKK